MSVPFRAGEGRRWEGRREESRSTRLPARPDQHSSRKRKRKKRTGKQKTTTNEQTNNIERGHKELQRKGRIGEEKMKHCYCCSKGEAGFRRPTSFSLFCLLSSVSSVMYVLSCSPFPNSPPPLSLFLLDGFSFKRGGQPPALGSSSRAGARLSRCRADAEEESSVIR